MGRNVAEMWPRCILRPQLIITWPSGTLNVATYLKTRGHFSPLPSEKLTFRWIGRALGFVWGFRQSGAWLTFLRNRQTFLVKIYGIWSWTFGPYLLKFRCEHYIYGSIPSLKSGLISFAVTVYWQKILDIRNENTWTLEHHPVSLLFPVAACCGRAILEYPPSVRPSFHQIRLE